MRVLLGQDSIIHLPPAPVPVVNVTRGELLATSSLEVVQILVEGPDGQVTRLHVRLAVGFNDKLEADMYQDGVLSHGRLRCKWVLPPAEPSQTLETSG